MKKEKSKYAMNVQYGSRLGIQLLFKAHKSGGYYATSERYPSTAVSGCPKLRGYLNRGMGR